MRNDLAWRMGEACLAASKASAGDLIDRGLALLHALNAAGFDVTRKPVKARDETSAELDAWDAVRAEAVKLAPTGLGALYSAVFAYGEARAAAVAIEEAKPSMMAGGFTLIPGRLGEGDEAQARQLRGLVIDAHRAHQRAMQPLMDQLARIEARRSPGSLVYTGTAGKLGASALPP